MEANKTVGRLVAAYRKAERDFAEVNKGSQATAFNFGRIIGELQGQIAMAAIELGHYGPMHEDEVKAMDA